MIKHAKSVHHKNKIGENASKPEQFWKCIKEIYPTKNKVSMSPLPKKLNSFFFSREKVEECITPGGFYLENFC